jgi:hypothetical protein
MPGSPQKRDLQEREATKRLELTAKAQADEAAQKLPRARVRYSPTLGQEIALMIANGSPIEDSTLKGVVLSPGIASRIGIHPATFYEWQTRYPEFAEAVAHARQESSHRVADRMLALADAALAEPALANAVRVAADILKWQAAVRNPGIYGERQRIDVHTGDDLGERLRRAKERVIDMETAAPQIPIPP